MENNDNAKISKNYLFQNIAFVLYVIIVFLVVAIIAFVNLLTSKNETYETVKAEYFTVTDTLEFTAVLVREEQVISKPKTPYLSYLYADGTKISPDTLGFTSDPVSPVLAISYSDYQMFKNAAERKKLEDKINELSFDQATKDQANFANISSSISKNYNHLISLISSKDFENIGEVEQDLTKVLNVKAFVLSSENNFDSLSAQINSQLENIPEVSDFSKETIDVDDSVYFSSKTDGLESRFNAELLKNSTEYELLALFNEAEKSNLKDEMFGKIITDYRYKIFTVINSDLLVGNFAVKENSNVKLRMNNEEINTTVESIKSIGNQVILVFDCDEKISNFSAQRVYNNAEILGPTYTGLRVPKEAIRPRGYDLEGTPVEYSGVWVKVGESRIFRRLACNAAEEEAYKKLKDEYDQINSKDEKTQKDRGRLSVLSEEMKKYANPILFKKDNEDFCIVSVDSPISKLNPHSRVIVYGQGYED
jgi:hypothetical protein